MEEQLLREGEALEDLQYKGFRIIQHEGKYRFTSDSVLLANFFGGRRGERMVELCAGSGVVGLLIAAKFPIAHMTLLEIQADLSDMSRRSVLYNRMEARMSAVCASVQEAPALFPAGFDAVCVNPPYQRKGSCFPNVSRELALCRHELALTLRELTEASGRLLKTGGRFGIVYPAERMSELFTAMTAAGIEPKRACLVCAREGLEPHLLLCEGRRGGRPGLRVSVRSAAQLTAPDSAEGDCIQADDMR